jgi:hypothetical protein
MTVVGALVAFPTLLMWRDRQTDRQRESILWVAFMSVYANVVGLFSCSEAAEPRRTLTPTGPALRDLNDALADSASSSRLPAQSTG